jgi:diaminohydroxyphosphoribosylaminopyrimidine deaminase/5-amino-6-(5-phosphoribosylamino)uracil reductase
MRAALTEAEKGLGRTHPNPAVGAIIVKGGRVVARGHHERAGRPHAEAMALRLAGAKARGATLYSTLEPCDHFGRTPPCTQAVLEAGIAEVVYGSRDPNPLVDGKGVERLRRNGVRVRGRVLEPECDALNRPFFKFFRDGLPYVTLKAAITLDGKIATSTGASKWITGVAAREDAHRLRDRVDALVVGAQTIVADDPRLTTRLPQGRGRSPVRVVVDPSLRTPLSARVYRRRGARTIAVASEAPRQRLRGFEDAGVEVWELPSHQGRLDLEALLQRLATEGLLHVALEGGARLFEHFLEARLVDEVVLYVAPKLFGHEGLTWTGRLGVGVPGEALHLRDLRVAPIGEDLRVTATVRRSRQARGGSSLEGGSPNRSR